MLFLVSGDSVAVVAVRELVVAEVRSQAVFPNLQVASRFGLLGLFIFLKLVLPADLRNRCCAIRNARVFSISESPSSTKGAGGRMLRVLWSV